MKRLAIFLLLAGLTVAKTPDLLARQLPPYGGAKEFVADLGARRHHQGAYAPSSR